MKVLNSGKLTRKYQVGGSVSITDPRKVRATSGKPINPNIDLVSGKYSLDHIKSVVNAAKRYDTDPLTLLAVDLRETTLGKKTINSKWFSGNVGQVNMDEKEFTAYPVASSTISSSEMPYERLARAYQTKQNDAKRLGITEEAKRILLYNGNRLTTNSYGVKVPKGGINLSSNPLYGKDVLDYRDNVYKKNSGLMEKVANTVNPVHALTTQFNWPPKY